MILNVPSVVINGHREQSASLSYALSVSVGSGKTLMGFSGYIER
jgi:hypothetical protein